MAYGIFQFYCRPNSTESGVIPTVFLIPFLNMISYLSLSTASKKAVVDIRFRPAVLSVVCFCACAQVASPLPGRLWKTRHRPQSRKKIKYSYRHRQHATKIELTEIAGLDINGRVKKRGPAMSTHAKSSVNVQSCNFSVPRKFAEI